MASRFALALALGSLFASSAMAQTVLVDDKFDTYTTQAELEAVWPVFFNTTLNANHPSMTLSTEQAKSGTNSLKNPGVTTAAGTAASPRNYRSFTDSGLPAAENLVHFEFDFYDAFPTVAPYRAFSGMFNNAAPSSSGGLVQMGLNNNQALAANGGNYYMGRIFGYDPQADGEVITDANPNGAFFKLNGPGAPLRSEGWHKLGVTVSDLDFKFYVDNILSRTVLRSKGVASTPNITIRSFDEIRIGSGVSNGDHASYVDNVSVVLNPVIVAPPANNADFNGDNIVDGKDFLIWQRGFGLTGQPNKSTGDANGDQNVDAADLAIWKTKFGGPPAADVAVAAVPEPAAFALAGVALLAGLAVKRRR
ncbi:dockerin type I domain-containing protein [Lacipirellula sp.]|uniref:dockerin type I domain-containing protein n=1 Tax=Lacipirellula sp. TaxID=2691419 RepID=UPI003D0BBED3